MQASKVLFALLRAAVCGQPVSEDIKAACTAEMLESVYHLANRHDLAHLVGQAVSKMNLPESDILKNCKQAAVMALGRYMRLEQEYNRTCQVLESAQIPFMPLKGAVLRAYYPEPWMRTSCDVDILVRPEDIDRAVAVLTKRLSYRDGGRATHDVTLYCPSGAHIELHFDLVEEGRANAAGAVLSSVWEDASLRDGYGFWYEMSDAFFYFYHIAHMAKHFETGGCGIRPFIDLWLLDNLTQRNQPCRDKLLQSGRLLQFAEAARKLSRVWFDGEEMDASSQRIERFLLQGGVYGSVDNRVALKRREDNSQLRYLCSRVFAPYEKLKAYYPILEKHRWLVPVMQVRRWFMLLKPDVFKMAKGELSASRDMGVQETDGEGDLLKSLGIDSAAW